MPTDATSGWRVVASVERHETIAANASWIRESVAILLARLKPHVSDADLDEFERIIRRTWRIQELAAAERHAGERE